MFEWGYSFSSSRQRRFEWGYYGWHRLGKSMAVQRLKTESVETSDRILLSLMTRVSVTLGTVCVRVLTNLYLLNTSKYPLEACTVSGVSEKQKRHAIDKMFFTF